MRKLISVTAILLLIVMLAAMTAGCAGENGDITDTPDGGSGITAAAETAVEYAPQLPALDFDGADFMFYTKMERDEDGPWTARDIWVEKETGESVNDAVFRRNQIVEEKYNMTIKQTRGLIGPQESYSMHKELSQIVMSDDNIYDVVMPTLQDLASLARDKMLVPLSALEYIDLDKPWWNDRFTRETSVAGKVYYANGDLSLTFMQAVYTILFNKEMIDNYGLDDPYVLVADGKWTFDKVHEMSAAVSSDVDGDGKITNADRVGLVVLNNSIDALYVSTGEKYVTIGSDGSFTFTGGSRRSLDMLEEIYRLYEAREYVLCMTDQARRAAGTTALNHNEASTIMFGDDRALFLFGTMLNVPRMRDMETDFGIVPTPMGTDNQDSYYTYVQTWASGGVGILITAKDADKSSVIIEDMSYLAREMITPEYYDVSLKTKFARDDESAGMLDLIYETRSVDMGYLFNIGNLVTDVRTMIYSSRKNNFASLIAGKEESINVTLAEITALYSDQP
jgi:hypothetical protein